MKRLYLRIYVAVLATLALFVGVLWFAWHQFSGMHDRPSAPALLAMTAADLLPRDAPREALQRSLERWRERTGADLALFGPDGAPIAAAGAPLPVPPRMPPRWGPREGPHPGDWIRRGDGPPAFALRLEDGRVLVTSRAWRPRMFGRMAFPGVLTSLVLIALAIGVGAYPVVRRLTRRLENLQLTVEKLGAGDLGARVAVSGRDEVASLAQSFNRSAERIEALVNSHKTLLANASHELRSPLARIRMAIELLGPSAPEATRAELARNIAELDQLVDEILLASRLDASASGAGARAKAFDEVDLTALAAEEAARIDADLDAETLVVRGDAVLLRRLLRNLLENAQRHGRGTQVEVTLRAQAQPSGAGRPEAQRSDAQRAEGQRAEGQRSEGQRSEAQRSDGSMVVLEVCDRGPGVPEADRDRIFEPFYRARGASERQGGVGLGLSLVRQIAAHHGGSAACRLREGGGSCFVVRLPRA